MFSEEAQALAKATVEAIKKIAERQEKECPDCDGYGMIDGDTPGGDLGCGNCKGLGKVKGKWEWEPEVGEWCIYGNAVLLITKVTVSVLEVSDGRIEAVKADKVIPLLEWQKIERILEGMGYVFEEPIRRCYGSEGFKCHCVISLNGKRVGWGWGKTRTEAVYAAVLELRKEE